MRKKYTIRREQNGSYSAVLNLKFVAMKEGYRGPVTSDQVPSYYRREVQECLEKANTKLLGPKGEKIQIVLEEPPPDKSPCPEPAKTIQIGPPGILSKSDIYASDIDCPVISHEILHQLGLCDEYIVDKRGYIVDSKTGEVIDEVENIYKVGELDSGQSLVLKYDCRVTRSNSLMAHQYERWSNVFFKETETSLLTPHQVSAILYGDCKKRNQLFNECSQLAYTSSFEDETCLKKRETCQSQNALGNP